MNPYVLILIVVVADGFAGLSGGLIPEYWLKRHQAALVAFAAGALLGGVFLDVLPETIRDYGPKALDWAVLGFLALVIVDWLLDHSHDHHEGECPVLPSTLLVSDALHNIGDGAAIAAGFTLATRAGIAVALAVVAHEVPQEVGDYALLRASGWRRGRSLLALAAVQLTAALGAGGVLFFAERFQQFTAVVLSMAAGSFLYIGATNLLPVVRAGPARERPERLFGFLLGLGLVVLLSAVMPA